MEETKQYMDLKMILKEGLENSELTEQKIMGIASLIEVCENLKKYPQLRNVYLCDLEHTHLSDVRLVAKCYKIPNVHAFTKHALIDMIINKYNELTSFCDSETATNDDA